MKNMLGTKKMVACPNSGKCGNEKHHFGSLSYRLCSQAGQQRAKIVYSSEVKRHELKKREFEAERDRLGLSDAEYQAESLSSADERLQRKAQDIGRYRSEPVLRIVDSVQNDWRMQAKEKYVETGDPDFMLLKEKHFTQ